MKIIMRLVGEKLYIRIYLTSILQCQMNLKNKELNLIKYILTWKKMDKMKKDLQNKKTEKVRLDRTGATYSSSISVKKNQLASM